ncbi:MAG: BON domain-containing protein [Bryobacteraceae bacterium]
MRPRYYAAVMAAILIAGSVFLAESATKPTANKAALPDAAVENSIRQRLARSKCASDNFAVHVRGGVATLEGKTDVVQRKGAATRMAKSAGAKRVINNIQVSAAGRAKASAGLSKGRRRVQVKRGEPRSER